MSELDEVSFDPMEYADQLGYTDELVKGGYADPNGIRAQPPEERRRGLTRRELLVKGGLGAAAIASGGTLAGQAAARPDKAGRSGAFSGTLITFSVPLKAPLRRRRR